MGFEIHICGNCDGTGSVREFTEATFDGIRAHEEMSLEVPCHTCGCRMDVDGSEFECPFCADTLQFAREYCIEEMSGSSYPPMSGKPGVFGGECPECGVDDVNGGPDGEVFCSSCSQFYAGQYSTEWFAYVLWNQGDRNVVKW